MNWLARAIQRLHRRRIKPPPLYWRCEICRQIRPDAAISVYHSEAVAGAFRLPQNVKYCNDRPTCAAAAPDFSFWRTNDH